MTKLDREIYNADTFFARAEIRPDSRGQKSYQKYLHKFRRPNRACLASVLTFRLPILIWLSQYRLRKYLLRDLLAGVTAGVIQIAPSRPIQRHLLPSPYQPVFKCSNKTGMANSQQAGLPPINGLYVALFSSLVYAFLGTSREMSVGTNGIICLMIQSALRKYEGLLYPAYHPSPGSHNASNSSSSPTASGYLSADADEAKVMLAGTLCLLVALVHLSMGLLNGGFIVRFISNVVINALTCSAAIVIVVGQVNSLMDFRIGLESRTPFKLAENLAGIFTNLQAANVGALVLSVLMISVMYFTNRFVNVWFKKRFKMQLPIELIVIVVVDLVSYLAAFNKRFGIKIVGDIPTQ